MVLMIIASLFALNVQASGLALNDVCKDKMEGNRIAKPLEKVGKTKWCMQVVCNSAKEQVDREVCVSQPTAKDEELNPYKFTLTQQDHYSKPGASGSRGTLLGTVELFKPDACFESCKPQQQKVLFSHKTVSAIESPACLECLIKQPRDSDKYELLGKGITLYKGQQCYYKCKPVGRENDMPIYSQECLDCAGSSSPQKSGGKPVAAKFYLIDGFNTCFEVIDGEYGKAWKVPMELCKKANKVYGTIFKRGSSYTVKTLFWGEEPKCIEMDDLSYGGYLKREVMDHNCDDKNVKDGDRSSGKDVQQKGGSQKSSGTGAKRQ